MKACPLCKSTYDDWIDFCFNDGMPLVAPAVVAAAQPAVAAPESVLDAPDIPVGLLAPTDPGDDPRSMAHRSGVATPGATPRPAAPEAPAAQAPPARAPAGQAPPAQAAPVQPAPAQAAPVQPAPAQAAPAQPRAPRATPPPDASEVLPIAPPAPTPLKIGAAGFDVEATDAPSAPLRIGAAGFDDPLPPPPVAAPAPAPAAARAPAPSPGAVDVAALQDIAAVLGGRAETPPPPVQMSVPTGFGLPPPPDVPPLAAPVAFSSALPPAPVVTSPGAPSGFPAAVAAGLAAPSPAAVSRAQGGFAPRDASTGFGLTPAAIGGIALAALAAAGVIWLLVRPHADSEGLASTERAEVVPVPAAVQPPPTPAVVVPPPVDLAPTPPVDIAAVPPQSQAATASSSALFPASSGLAAPPRGSERGGSHVPAPPSEPTPASGTTTNVSAGGDGVADAGSWQGAAAAAPSAGTLSVLSDPEGASVFVDDVARGQTPLSLDVPYGAHRVRVEHAGYKAEGREIEVRSATATVPFALKPDVVTGQVNVYGPMGYRVVVDGHDMGPMPVTVQVNEGVRQFKLMGEAGQTCVIPKEIAFRSPGRPETVTLQCP
jgi:hypothetical protein